MVGTKLKLKGFLCPALLIAKPLPAITMKLIYILISIFIIQNANGQNDSIRGNQFVLKGKLINEVLLPPGCGTIAWGTVIELEVMEYSDSNYEMERIGVIVPCPDFYKNRFFKVGKTYKILLADENQSDFDFSIPNESILSKYKLMKKLWVIQMEKIKSR